jgi:hypothetical protein
MPRPQRAHPMTWRNRWTTGDSALWSYLALACLSAALHHPTHPIEFAAHISSVIAGGLTLLLCWGRMLHRCPGPLEQKIKLRLTVPPWLVLGILLSSLLPYPYDPFATPTDLLRHILWITLGFPLAILAIPLLFYAIIPLLLLPPHSCPSSRGGIPDHTPLPPNPPLHPITITTMVAIAAPSWMISAITLMWRIVTCCRS